MKQQYQAYLFDLDGTLIDPKSGILQSIVLALREMDESIPAESVLEQFIGPPLKASFTAFCGFDEDKADAAVRLYRGHYGAGELFRCTVYPGVEETLSLLQRSGRELYVATSKPLVFAQRILDHFGLSGYFTEIVGSGLHGELGSKEEVIQYILTHHGVAPQAAAMVGDRKFDILPAKKLGLGTIAALYGYGSQEELSETKPDHWIRSFRELSALE